MTPRTLSLLALPLLAAALTGCGRKYPTVTATSLDGHARLIQPFALSAMSRDAAGDWDVVLVSQGLEKDRSLTDRVGTAVNPVHYFRNENPAGADLKPATSAPIRQVVHMKLHWRPSRGAKADNPAAANATVRWLVFGTPSPAMTLTDATTRPAAGVRDGAAQGVNTFPDLLEYQGTAFVRPIFERDGYTLLIREGDVERTLIRGEMADVLGPAKLEGKFYVPDDPYTVANVLRELPRATPVTPPAAVSRPATRPTPRAR